jgi:hypothetical protein
MKNKYTFDIVSLDENYRLINLTYEEAIVLQNDCNSIYFLGTIIK